MPRCSSMRRSARRFAPAVTSLFIWSAIVAPALQAVANAPTALVPKAIPPAKQRAMIGVPTVRSQEPYIARTSGNGQIPLSLLDEVGRLAHPIPDSDILKWKRELNAARTSSRRTALLHLWLGEIELAQHQEPETAIEHFRMAQHQVRHSTSIYGLAAYDSATSLFYEGAYKRAARAFRNLLTASGSRQGFSRRECALWLKHSSACAGYHDEREKLGITEPGRTDPLCAVAGLAVCLRAIGLPYDKTHLLPACRHTGEGSNLKDIIDACNKLKLVGRAVTADEKGLVALPKPLIAYVEKDHFIAVTGANKDGVSYVCSDCGDWPGGHRNLSWKQWRMMEATVYVSVAKKGSPVDTMMSSLLDKAASNRAGMRMASIGRVPSGTRQMLTQLSLLRGHVALYIPFFTGVTCGSKPEAGHCNPMTCCTLDIAGAGSADGGGDARSSGPGAGDPVNLATGEEEYSPSPDLVVYNPKGPSVVWSRLYNSLRGPDRPYESYDHGVGWSHPYNIAVLDTGGGGGVGGAGAVRGRRIRPNAGTVNGGSKYLVFPNGSRVLITASATPSASQPHISCTVPTGTPFLVDWYFNATTQSNYFVITNRDRTTWTTTDLTNPVPYTWTAPFGWYPLQKVTDRNGNSISFTFVTPVANSYPLISSILDGTGQALLTVTRSAGTGNITAISDRYGRSVYYHNGTYNTQNVTNGLIPSYQEVDQVSQVVATGTPTPPIRWQYGYQNVLNGEANETVPFLHTIGVPSPTGTGTATSTINYEPYTCYVTNIVDANGNTRTYTVVDANHTKVTVTNPQQATVYSYTAGFDNNMSGTSLTDGSNTTAFRSKVYADPNDPYRPSTVTDGAGVSVTLHWDQYGNPTTNTSARGVVGTFTWSYANFALGEMTQSQYGNKTPNTFSYYEPSGLVHTVNSAAPGHSGDGVTVQSSCTWDSLGNMLTATRPGNNAVPSITTTWNYTTDGGYSQPAAIGQALTLTDNLGKVIHYRYDLRCNKVSTVDALGNEIDFSWNLANQPVQITLPATGQTGTGRGGSVYSYFYIGGPLSVLSHYNESAVMVRQVSYTYGAEGELLSRSGAVESTSKTYDAVYRVKTLTDGNNHAISYAYNSAGYLTSTTYPNTDNIQFPSYNATGHCVARTDGRGVVTNYTYGDASNSNHLTDVQFPATPALNVHYSYDGYGRLSTVADGTGTRTFTYDDLNDVTGLTTTYTGLPSRSIAYSYNPDRSRASMVTPGGTFYYSYDGFGRLVNLSGPSGSTTWTYLATGWLWTQQAANGATATYTYNSWGSPTRIFNQAPGGAVLSDYSNLGYDGVGNMATVTGSLTAAPAYGGQTNYTYDSKNEITQEASTRGGGYTNNFGFDGAGNPTTFKGIAGTFNSDNQSTLYTHDGNGNPTTYKGVTYAYDAENRITAIGTVLTAGYAASGMRAWKQTSAGRTYFLYDASTPVIEMDASGSVTAINTFGVNGLLSRKTGATSTYYSFDPQGNVSQRLDSSGNVLSSFRFDVYGVGTSTGAPVDPFGFRAQVGYYTDLETGLQLLGHRYYDPGTGRFITRDPIGPDGGTNLYAYVKNRPTRLADNTGFAAVPVVCLIPCVPCLSCLIDLGLVCSDCGLDAKCWGEGLKGTIDNLPPWAKWLCGGACGGCIGCLLWPRPGGGGTGPGDPGPGGGGGGDEPPAPPEDPPCPPYDCYDLCGVICAPTLGTDEWMECLVHCFADCFLKGGKMPPFEEGGDGDIPNPTPVGPTPTPVPVGAGW